MKRPPFFIHPILVFILSLIALCTSFFLFLHWYFKVSNLMNIVVSRLKVDRQLLLDPSSWVIVLMMAILISMITVGLAIIFIYYQKSQQLFRLQENFINNFTHELKTPLASIKLYLETFQKHDLSKEEQAKFLNYMLKDTERLTTHVNQILQLASMENKKIEYTYENWDLAVFLEDYLVHSNHLYHRGKITIKKADDGPFFYFINPSLFSMLFTNLLTNAFKYCEEVPDVVITLSRPLKQKRKVILIQVTDNGIGIDAKFLKDIFKKFYQIGQSRDCTAQGNGIGLYLAHQIVKAHGGKIWAESHGPETGKGSSFFISFPIKEVLTKESRDVSLEDPHY